MHLFPEAAPGPARPSPLMLADHILTIAQESDRAGFTAVAARLLGLAYDVLDPASPPH